MLSKSEARDKVAKLLTDEVAILDDQTREYSWGWVFFYESQKYLETGENRDRLLGNAPFIVNRESGEFAETGTAHETEHYVKKYEARLRDS